MSTMEDRVLASLSGLPAAEETTPEATEAPAESVESAAEVSDTFEFEIDGEKYTLPKKLESHLQRDADYTQKTQELSHQKRALEQAREQAISAGLAQQFNDSIAAERNEMAVIDAYLSQINRSDWSSMNLEQVMRHRLEIDNIKERKSAIEKSINDKRSQFDNNYKAKINELKGKARDAATKSIQNFSEDTEKQIRAFASSEGLTDAEIDSVLLDPRSFRILWKAQQFDQVKAGTQHARKAVEARAVKPGGSTERMPAATRADLDFRKAMKSAPTSSQKARVIEERMAQRFGGK